MRTQWLDRKNQMGVALFASLMILLVLSVLGIAAMRMMASQSQVASGSLGAEISYSIGATAINTAIRSGEANPDLVLPSMNETRILCLTNTTANGVQALVPPNTCKGTDADARGVSNATVTVTTLNTDADTPAQAQARLADRVRRFGSVPGVTVDYFDFASEGDVDALEINNTQVQEVFYPHL